MFFGRRNGGRGGRGGRPPEHTPPATPVEPPVETPAAPLTPAAEAPSGDVAALTPEAAIELLKAGNRAFLSGQGMLDHASAKDLAVLQHGQHPIAAVVACADSRTPPTILFNQGLGRLFIVRVAGNTVDRRGLASIVYAVKQLNCPVVVVMGHTGCGAVGLAQAVVEGRSELDPALQEMVTPIIPAVLHARARGAADMATASVEENARQVAAGLKIGDTSLAAALANGKLKIVAAVKDIHTGEVRFLD